MLLHIIYNLASLVLMQKQDGDAKLVSLYCLPSSKFNMICDGGTPGYISHTTALIDVYFMALLALQLLLF